MKVLLRNRKLGRHVHSLYNRACRALSGRGKGKYLIIPGLIRLSLTGSTQYSGRLSLQAGVGRVHKRITDGCYHETYPWYGHIDLRVDDSQWHECTYAEFATSHSHWGVANYVWHDILTAERRKEVIAERRT